MPPAKVFVIGAGVAGLAAIGAARGLGAIVRAIDTRAEVRRAGRDAWAREFVEFDYEEEGEGGGGYAKEMSEGFHQAPSGRLFAQAGQGGGHHHHHRADPRQAGAQADHRRDGASR